MRERWSGDRGSATLWLLTVGLVLVAAGGAGAVVGAVRVAHQRARVAADAGALAGAIRASRGTTDACARAAEFVRANGGELTSCVLDGLDVEVTVEVRVVLTPALSRTAEATARAGPVRSG